MDNSKYFYQITVTAVLLLSIISAGRAQKSMDSLSLDDRVRSFLMERESAWHDMNIPEIDGQLLYDIIVQNKYTRALEIGTSTGRSGIWIAWALSKTGGRLITIEINESRHREAVENFKQTGLSQYIDARLADAHQLVRELEGPFDFVFCDADKNWYKNYFIDLYPKLEVNGCYTAHNVSDSGWRRLWGGGAQEFYQYVRELPNMDTSVNTDGNGVSISFKRSE